MNGRFSIEAPLGGMHESSEIALYYGGSFETFNPDFSQPIFSQAIPAGTRAGNYHIHIPSDAFTAAPSGTQYLILVGITNAGPLDNRHWSAEGKPDVQITLAGNALAKQSVPGYALSDYTLNVIKDVMRRAGRFKATISSTVRTPLEQVEAMFTNLTKPGGVARQRKLYLDPGNAVIDTYVQVSDGMTTKQILAARDSIVDQMLNTIDNLPNGWGPYDVSHHCATPEEWAARNVVDVSISVGRLFFQKASQEARVAQPPLAPPRDPAYFIEIPQA
jgi:hypothetical protein